ncbi:hypothetical protein Nepgr_011595 [Nepenthes gracilis]|uniref:Uncharacterized protein n=1 Tax=Nepenthes gracilis TaxID=150966 RepID=A0AAD3SFL8_NEPGR|nr:hypothetical protein Nepgr_011595 [Nepenthes gracilis]
MHIDRLSAAGALMKQDNDPLFVALGNDDFGGALCLELVRATVEILLSFWVMKLVEICSCCSGRVALIRGLAEVSKFPLHLAMMLLFARDDVAAICEQTLSEVPSWAEDRLKCP